MNDKTLTLKLRFNAENKEFIGQVKSSAKVVDDLGTKSNKAGAGLKTLSKESKSAGVDLSSLKSQVLGLAGGFSALAVAINAKDTLGQYQDMRTQITALVGGQEQWLQTEQYLNQVAEEHNKTILDMAQSYARLSVLQEAGLVTQRETMMLFEGMSNAQSQLGATTTQLDQAMYGLSQALASPIVRAEELNQVVEPLPGLLNKLDKAAGLNAGGFRQMMLDGKVTSDFFKTTLIKALADYEGAAARTAQNVNAQQAAFSRSYQQMVLAFEKPISNVFSDSVSASTSVLKVFGDNAELITDLVGVAMFAALGRGAAAVASMTKVKIRDIAADRQKIVAEQQKNVVELASIQSEIRHLEVMRATNAQRFAATGAVNALTAAEAREKVVKDAIAASQARLNVLMRAGTGLMALLGGPAGVVMMAAGAIGYFALTSDQAKDSSEGLKDELSNLISEYKELNEVGKERFAQNLANGAVEARRALIDTQIAINKVKSELADAERSGSPLAVQKRIELSSLEAQAEKFEQAVVKSNAAYQELLKTNTDGKWQEPVGEGSQTEEQEKALKAGERMLENLAKQAALYGNTSEVARVRYEIEKGSLQGINDQLKEQLLLQARIIDQKRAAEENPKEEPKTDKIDDFFDSSDDLNSSYLQRLAIQADYENRAKIQEQYAYAERKEQLKLRFEEAYAQAQGNHSLMNTLESEYFQNRQVLRQEHEMNLTDISKQAADERAAYQQRVAADTLSFTQQQLSITTDFLRQSGQEQSAMYRTLLAVQKLAAIPSMIIATEEAATKALTLGPIAGPIASAAVKTLGYASVGIVAGQAIAGQAHDGIDRVPQANEGTWLLKADEMVLNPSQADNFRWMVDAMRTMKSAVSSAAGHTSVATGLKSINVNVHGVERGQVQSFASESDSEINIDVIINKAVNRSLEAVYSDFDNGGPISMRSKSA